MQIRPVELRFQHVRDIVLGLLGPIHLADPSHQSNGALPEIRHLLLGGDRSVAWNHGVEVQLQRLHARLAQQQLSLKMDPSATRFLAKEGYDPQFGARPLKRAIQEFLLNPLAMKLLYNEIKPGDTIKVTADAGKLKFQPQK